MDHSLSFEKLWNQCESKFPIIERTFTESEQMDREGMLSKLVLSLRQWEKRKREMDNDSEQQIFEELRYFFSRGLDYSQEQLEVIFSEEMVKATYHFIQAARKFDPKINFHDVFQACRNVWIMNGLQFLFGAPIELTPSIFAYSMLYPYTDNYIDDPSVSSFEKYQFSIRFADRLAGANIQAINEQEVKIFRMVEIIEAEWDRQVYPTVYDSLLEIHRAQTTSAKLIAGNDNLSPQEAFKICIDKGGASVVADGYLIFGTLSNQQESFFYDYGAYLQLLDDIQDVGDDLKDGLHTWHGFQAQYEHMEYALNKTWASGQMVLNRVNDLNIERGEVFKSLMSKSIDLFLIEAVIANGQYFSEDYSQKFEKYSPFSFSFVKKRSGSFTPFQDQFFENIERFAMQDDTADFWFLKKESLSNNLQQAD
ncbi:class 1 isoprenoid biosynthesis enzyme [Sunxiuqinia sp. A32]|uniref:class 1 isoprenoid biosynthesis enzyme n=1 Tax=Sunxiuqinia sp. A32 TaxID=3461496 RepID=UPI00404670A8